MKHTPEPWDVGLTHAEGLGQYLFVVPIYSGGARVATARGPTMEIAIANAERIVRCVNACAGIANPEAIKGAVEAAQDILINPRAAAILARYVPGLFDRLEAALAALKEESK